MFHLARQVRCASETLKDFFIGRSLGCKNICVVSQHRVNDRFDFEKGKSL